MKYKVGEKVRVREDVLVGVNYGCVAFAPEMRSYKGKESLIKKVYSNRYNLELSSEFVFNDEMLDLVEENIWTIRGTLKGHFEEIKEDKQVKEYTIKEVFEEDKGTKFKNRIQDIYWVEDDILMCDINGIKTECKLTKDFLNDRFTKVEPLKVTFLEAWKEQEEGKEVVSCRNYNYKNNKRLSEINGEWINLLCLEDEEIRGSWIIL
jgi:hypothetical protein